MEQAEPFQICKPLRSVQSDLLYLCFHRPRNLDEGLNLYSSNLEFYHIVQLSFKHMPKTVRRSMQRA